MSDYIVQFIIEKSHEKDFKRQETIRYGIKVLWVNLYKFPIIFGVAYILGILDRTIIAYISFALLRAFAGGLHSSRGIYCLISSMCILYGPVFMSNYISWHVNLIMYIFSFIAIILYAPSDTKNKPLLSSQFRKELKYKSILVLSFIFVSSLMLPKEISNIMSLTTFIESLMILPLTYKLFRKEMGSYA